MEEELNVQHSTFNFQRRIEEIKKSEEKEKKESMANNGKSPSPVPRTNAAIRQGLYKSTSLKYRKVAPS
jgi:hypothetical protein